MHYIVGVRLSDVWSLRARYATATLSARSSQQDASVRGALSPLGGERAADYVLGPLVLLVPAAVRIFSGWPEMRRVWIAGPDNAWQFPGVRAAENVRILDRRRDDAGHDDGQSAAEEGWSDDTCCLSRTRSRSQAGAWRSATIHAGCQMS